MFRSTISSRLAMPRDLGYLWHYHYAAFARFDYELLLPMPFTMRHDF